MTFSIVKENLVSNIYIQHPEMLDLNMVMVCLRYAAEYDGVVTDNHPSTLT